MLKRIKKFFELEKNDTDFSTELTAGITTFLTMSYIIAVNPAILSLGGKGVPFAGTMTATVVVAALSTILMGLMANLPYALAPGMGINAFFAYTLVAGMGLPWQTALGAVLVSGVIFILLTAAGIRRAVVKAIPQGIRYGVASGIGLFLAVIGLRAASFVIPSEATMVKFGGFNTTVVVFLAGFAITAVLAARQIRGAMMIGIVLTTMIAAIPGRLIPGTMMVILPDTFVELPDFSTAFLQLDITGALRPELAGVIFVFLFTDMFDSLSTFMGVAQVAGLNDRNGEPRNLNKALMVDALSTVMSGLAGTSSGTTYIESAAGVREGGRTGLTALITGLLFIPFLFLSPAVKMVPAVATAPVLVMVGFYMMSAMKNVKFSKLEEGLPAFTAMLLIPMCYSITQGICWSFLVYSLLKVCNGKAREIPVLLWVIDVLSVFALIMID